MFSVISEGIRTGSLLRIEYGKNRNLPSHRQVQFGKNRDIPIFPPIQSPNRRKNRDFPIHHDIYNHHPYKYTMSYQKLTFPILLSKLGKQLDLPPFSRLHESTSTACLCSPPLRAVPGTTTYGTKYRCRRWYSTEVVQNL